MSQPSLFPLGLTVRGFWVNDWSPFLGPHWGNFGVRYYGLTYVLGFLTAGWLLQRYTRTGRSRLPEAKIADLMIAMVIGVLLGGRLGYFLLYQMDTVRADPLVLFRVWEGGMASHGGMVGVALALAWFARAEKISFLHLGDLIVSAAPPGLFLVRVANFINGELWGRISAARWAVIFPHSEPTWPVERIPPRHPSQLYEAALEGLLLLALMQWRVWRSDVLVRKPGRLAGEFLVAYALVRMIGETFREPDAGLILGLSRGTFYSVFLICAGLVLILRPNTSVEQPS